MNTTPHFIELQYRFSAHMRDPEANAAPPGIEDRRLGIYRDLFYRNVEGFMANAFPVLRRLTPDARWHAMVRDYYRTHEAHTPLFPRMPQEFLRYLADERNDEDDPPFIAELAHYEWLEADVQLDTHDVEDTDADREGNLLDGIPVLNPVLRLEAYAWPVHRIAPDFQPAEAPAEPTYLAVYRRRDDEVRFMALNAVAARLLDLLRTEPQRCGREQLERIAAELGQPGSDSVLNAGSAQLEDFRAREIILGVRDC